jgi:ABC-2 type transport system permease protein
MAGVISSVRLFFIGGLISYRALFAWLRPWILIPTFIFSPLFQILLFAYIGRTAQVGNDEFFLIGNAVNYAAIPCLFAMGDAVAGERYSATLPLLLISPARRVPLFLGRALPVLVNAIAVAAIGLVGGALALRVTLPLATIPPLVLVVIVASFSCTGLGMLSAAIALRVREVAVLSNVVFGILLIFTGVNVAVASLPGWMQAIAAWMPLTHGIAAAREVAQGASVGDVGPLLAAEAGLGVLYTIIGLVLLRVLEWQSRRLATLDQY